LDNEARFDAYASRDSPSVEVFRILYRTKDIDKDIDTLLLTFLASFTSSL